ncbi:urease accessory protein UreE [Lyngbya sp. PCC 8106]|uniref:urease accessory protein UreE n=1 Tax=Lyngbya sp. (strain PCC 8106) TaxID=313612 RepID=UPI0000EAB6E8|nr:urease accessory protein UreE [Lyngbya sp. PCC 8106]EAW36606.1 UreE urease accessory-like protein [Lyngbya sp. PCC 8106]
MIIIFTQYFQPNTNPNIDFIIPLTAEQRYRSRQKIELSSSQKVYLNLPRGTVLEDGSLLQSETQEYIAKIVAQPEPVITVKANTQLDLIRAAYHLGNRHVPLEITSTYLRLSPDSVLESMLVKLGLEILAEVAPFYPEKGAYGHHH